jgi:hypothetical protein
VSDLTEFLLARIAEDEAVAREATRGPWLFDAISGAIYAPEERTATYVHLREDVVYGDDGVFSHNAAHIIRHDPARVLAEIEAKRAALAEFVDAADGGNGEGYMAERAMQYMALPYAEDPGFREVWRP